MTRRALILALALTVVASPTAAVEALRGAYVFKAAGCAGCHTAKADREAKVIGAGGRALKTPFGIFYSPNITPDLDTGIGTWSLHDFQRALHKGRAPDGSAYFPVFPYPRYTAMTDGDVGDLWAYLRTLPAVRRTNQSHDVAAPMGWRLAAKAWQALFFTPTKAVPPTRGAYLVNVLGHCGECHTPRDVFGVLDDARALAGTRTGPHGGAVPNLTPDKASGIGKWSEGDLQTLFTLGMQPNLDFAGDGMGEVVSNTTSHWTNADRAAVIAYLKSLPAMRNDALVKKKKKSGGGDPWD